MSTWIELPKRTGSGGSGTPSGSDGSIQIANSGNFSSDPQLKWDSANHEFNLNGLAIRALSTTYSLVDNNPTPTTVILWDVAYRHTIIEYSVDRGSDTQTGIFLIASTASTAKLVDQKIDTSETVDLGITFSTVISGSDVILQYTTSATGFNGFLRMAARQW
jgi:hypothetical protein